MKQYFWRILIAIDQLANTILGGNEDETISSRMGKKLVQHEKCPFCNFLCKILNKIDPNHCIKSIEYDEGEKIS